MVDEVRSHLKRCEKKVRCVFVVCFVSHLCVSTFLCLCCGEAQVGAWVCVGLCVGRHRLVRGVAWVCVGLRGFVCGEAQVGA